MAHTETTLNSQTIFSGRIIEVKRTTSSWRMERRASEKWWSTMAACALLQSTRRTVCCWSDSSATPTAKSCWSCPPEKSSWAKTRANVAFGNYRRNVAVLPTALKKKLAQLYPTPAYCTEVIHIYCASGLHESVQKLDDGEFLDVLRIPFAQAVQMVMDGEISDAKTQIGILSSTCCARRRASNKHSTQKAPHRSVTPGAELFYLPCSSYFSAERNSRPAVRAATIAAVIPPALALSLRSVRQTIPSVPPLPEPL